MDDEPPYMLRKFSEVFQPSMLSWEDNETFVWITKQFHTLAGPDGALDKTAFQKVLQVKKSFFADRLFEVFDMDNNGSIDLAELLLGLRKLTKGSPTEKLKLLFKVYDADDSGSISREELGTVLRSCMEESCLELSEDNLDALTDVLFDFADTNKSGYITFEELQNQLEKRPSVMNNLTISAAQWLIPPEKKRLPKAPRYLTLTYIRNNQVKVFFTIFYVLVNIGLYLLNGWFYWHSNWYIIVARGAGMCLDFNCAFILVLVLRTSLTWLRNTPLVRILPFDQHVMFHKLAGYAVVFFSLVHTAAHLGNAAVNLTTSTKLNLVEILFTLKADIGWIYGLTPLTGVVLDVILVVMFISSMDFVRRSGKFEVFYWTHKLYIPFYVLNILHAANFWKWIVGPGAIFCLEVLFRMRCIRRARNGAMHIESVSLLPTGVTQLSISRPAGFHFRAGDYVFLNIPAIAKYEWHPFTISSAPEMKGTFTLHIRSAGHWTKTLYDYFTTEGRTSKDPELGQTNFKKAVSKKCSIREKFSFRRRNTKAIKKYESVRQRVRSMDVHVPVNVDGPYGTATSRIFQAEHAVLICSGIGVTPFASILQSVLYRFRQAKVTCPSCSHSFCASVPNSVMSLKKVDFVWINRDQRNFEWFFSMLVKLEREQSRGGLGHVLDMHMYMTSALTKNDMKGIGLQLALDLIHENEQTDLITGLQTRTQAGRPDFDQLFTQISMNAKGKIKVFFCGSPVLGHAVKASCAKLDFPFSKENF